MENIEPKFEDLCARCGYRYGLHRVNDNACPVDGSDFDRFRDGTQFLLKPNWPDPTTEMLNDPRFNAIWEVIKTWDINTPHYVGYCGATGNHARAIFDALFPPGPTGTMGHKDPKGLIEGDIHDRTPTPPRDNRQYCLAVYGIPLTYENGDYTKDWDEMEKLVNKKIAEGWKPIGGLTIERTHGMLQFVQPMVAK